MGWMELLLGRLGSFDIKALAAFKSLYNEMKKRDGIIAAMSDLC